MENDTFVSNLSKKDFERFVRPYLFDCSVSTTFYDEENKCMKVYFTEHLVGRFKDFEYDIPLEIENILSWTEFMSKKFGKAYEQKLKEHNQEQVMQKYKKQTLDNKPQKVQHNLDEFI